MTVAPSNHNAEIIEEFRANAGIVGGRYAGRPVILVHHQGRKSGLERINPLTCQPLENGWAVFASYGGAPHHPDWFLNLLAHPVTSVEFGTETAEVTVRVAEGEEREALWRRQKHLAPIFAEYEVKAGERQIPVVVLERVR
jgi:deazaflavin-dependent oxidoreductase (nitroreductase family)